MRPWDAKRELLEEAKCHWVSAIGAIVAAAASAYGASKQASAAKKSKLAAANAAVSGQGGGGAPGQTIASQTRSIERSELGKLPSQAQFFDSPGDLPGGGPGVLGDLPQGRSYGDMLALSPGPTQAPGSSFEAEQPPQTKEVPYQDAMGMSDNGKQGGGVKQYADLASSALPLILALTQGNAPQAAPRPQVAPYSYQPTAMTYRQRMGFL